MAKGKTIIGQPMQQSREASIVAVERHYRDDCECRNCRRQRRKITTRPVERLDGP